jgi:Uma2 family endonuclease
MVYLSPQDTTAPPPLTTVPPLESGDRLTRHEFERRYTAHPDIKKAELIEGVVYVASPLRFKRHAEPHADLTIWAGVYKVSTPGVRLGIEPTIRLDEDNEPQPDAVLLLPQAAGGRSRFTEDDYVEGAPELVIEVAASSVSIDLNQKKNAYRRNGVQEYLVWQIFENRLNWFSLQDGEYVDLKPNPDGIIQSQVFPGLWLSATDLLTGDMPSVLAVLQQGMSSQSHVEFVESLTLAPE